MDSERQQGCSGLSPVKKHKQGKGFHTGEKTQIINTYKTLLNDNPDVAKTDIVAKVSSSLGVSIASVYRILKEYRSEGEVKSPQKKKPKHITIIKTTDDFTKAAIRSKMHTFYSRNEIPTLDRILSEVNNDQDLPNFSRTTFYRLIQDIGFRYKKRTRKSYLLDRDDLVIWRRKFLRDIRRYREQGKPIYYLDETWINEGLTKSKVWQDQTISSAKEAFLKGLTTGLKNPSGKGKRLIVVHIGNEHGFVNDGLWVFESHSTNEYHEEMTGEAFHEWFGKILQYLEPGSVIVLDNAPYHSVKSEKLPVTSWKKENILAWLKTKNIALPTEQLLKKEMLQIVSQYRSVYDKYVVDEMAKSRNMTVLRLPPYHCELNPIEYVWAQVKGYVAAHNTTFKMKDVKPLFHKAIEEVTAEKWANCVRHVIETEETRLWDMDDRLEEVEELIINLEDEATSESE